MLLVSTTGSPLFSSTLPIPPTHPPLPQPILCMSPTPHTSALSNRSPLLVQARCRGWPRASFSAAHRTRWPRRRPRPPVFQITPLVSHAHTRMRIWMHAAGMYTPAANVMTRALYPCIHVYICSSDNHACARSRICVHVRALGLLSRARHRCHVLPLQSPRRVLG